MSQSDNSLSQKTKTDVGENHVDGADKPLETVVKIRGMSKAIVEDDYHFEVPFFDVDSMNVVWHGHYCKYLEVSRCQLLEKIGYSYHDMKASGYSFPVVDMRIKYLRPILFGQRIIIRAGLVEWENRLKIQYVIFDENLGEKLTKAYTIQAAVDHESQIMKLVCPSVFTDKVKPFL